MTEMAQIIMTPRFKREYKRLKKKHYDMDVMNRVLKLLFLEQFDVLEREFDDHALLGGLTGGRSIHVQPNWILLYSRVGERGHMTVTLLGTGSHDDYKKW